MCKVSTTPVLLCLLFCDVTLCSVVDGYQNFGWNIDTLTWRWKHMVSPSCWYLSTTFRRHHIPVHHNHHCKILKSLICLQCYYTLICPFVLQRRRASIATFRPLDSQDSTKTSSTSLTFGVSLQCEGRVVYHLVRSLFIFVSTAMSIMCLGPHRVLRVLPLTVRTTKMWR
jgi:hypothetical protein